MVGLDIEKDSWKVLEAGIERANYIKDQNGILMLSSGPNTLRLLPPYIITDSEIDQGIGMINELLG